MYYRAFGVYNRDYRSLPESLLGSKACFCLSVVFWRCTKVMQKLCYVCMCIAVAHKGGTYGRHTQAP